MHYFLKKIDNNYRKLYITYFLKYKKKNNINILINNHKNIRRDNMALPIATIEKIIRKAGAYRVSKGAAKELSEFLEDWGVEIAQEAMRLAEHAGRKTVKSEDIELAIKRL
ncbi:MAG: histone family protein [Candidatus Methanofastidiosia archaeon]